MQVNGLLRIAGQILGVVFIAGVLWAKVDAVQTAVRSIEQRVAQIESVLMTGQSP